MRILHADDTAEWRQLIARMLGYMHHTVVTVEDGDQLLEQLDSDGAFDVVITDFSMPNVSGWNVLRRVRADPRFKHLPVLVMTAEDDVREMVEKAGGIFILKDEARKQLTAALKQLEAAK